MYELLLFAIGVELVLAWRGVGTVLVCAYLDLSASVFRYRVDVADRRKLLLLSACCLAREGGFFDVVSSDKRCRDLLQPSCERTRKA